MTETETKILQVLTLLGADEARKERFLKVVRTYDPEGQEKVFQLLFLELQRFMDGKREQLKKLRAFNAKKRKMVEKEERSESVKTLEKQINTL